MRKDDGDTGHLNPAFSAYLDRAIAAAGYPTRAHFARAAGIDQSTVNRWGKTTMPSPRKLAQVAPTLRVPADDLISAAYPAEASPPAMDEIETMILGAEDLTDDDKRWLIEQHHRRREAAREQDRVEARTQMDLIRRSRAS